MNNQSVLILGSQGFIGNHLCKYFAGQGHRVTGCDIVEHNTNAYLYHKVSVLSFDFETLFTTEKFDVCINASGSGNVGYSFTHPQSDFESNTIVVAKLLETIRKFQPSCRLLHISSAAVYGNPASLPVAETAAASPVSSYGYHKYMSEVLCKQYAGIYNVAITILRPFSVYGNGLKKQLLWDICTKLDAADEIELFGTGKESRDFIHIDDLVLLVDIILEKSRFKLDIYNAASGTDATIREIASIFEKHFGRGKAIRFSGQKKEGDPLNWVADTTKINGLGFHNKVQLEAGIVDYINWYRLNAEG